MSSLFDLEKKDDITARRVVLELKFSEKGVSASPNLICSLCGDNLEPNFTQKRIHFILCERCRDILNQKLSEGHSVAKQSLSIAMFEKGDI